MKKDMHGELRNMEIEEISVVTRAANKKKFLFLKQDEEKRIEITSDGTREGTVIRINSRVIEQPEGIAFNLYRDFENKGQYHVDCSYTQIQTESDGTEHVVSYTVRKEDSMNKDLMKQLKEYFGKDFEFAKVEQDENTVATLVGLIEKINTYSADYPDDLRESIGSLMEYAISGYGVEKTEDPVNEDKKVDEAEEEKEEEVSEEAGEDQTDATAEAEAEKKVEAEKAERKKFEEGVSDALAKIMEGQETLSKRLEVVEKTAGTRKSIADEENEDKSIENPYPSLG